METYFGNLISADFEESTMEFEIETEFTIKKGRYAIVPMVEYEKLVNGAELKNDKALHKHFVSNNEVAVNCGICKFADRLRQDPPCNDCVRYNNYKAID